MASRLVCIYHALQIIHSRRKLNSPSPLPLLTECWGQNQHHRTNWGQVLHRKISLRWLHFCSVQNCWGVWRFQFCSFTFSTLLLLQLLLLMLSDAEAISSLHTLETMETDLWPRYRSEIHDRDSVWDFSRVLLTNTIIPNLEGSRPIVYWAHTITEVLLMLWHSLVL